MPNTAIFTNFMRTSLLEELVTSMADANNGYFAYISRYTPWSDEPTAENIYETYYDTHYLPHREMIYGKKFNDTETRYLVANNTWTTNTVYSMYDDQESLRGDAFFVITDERKVFKCLYNAANAASTSKPTTTANTPFQTGDGYIWKYMYTAPQLDLDNHGTTSFVPISPNTDVQDASVDGALDVILIDTNGNNWIATNNGAIQAKVSNTLVQIANTASTQNGYYTDSAFYVSAGNGAGDLSPITDYISNATGNFVVLANGTANSTFGSQYLITPQIRITGDGTGAKAYSTVNSTSFKLLTINVIDPGSGYSRATVNAIAAAGFGNSSVVLRGIIGPPGGHGSDPVNELFAQRLSATISISNTDSVPANLDFRVAGIIKNPLASGTANVFSNSEFLQHYRATISLAVGHVTPYVDDELVTGQTSGATGTVIWSNTTHLKFGDVLGTFSNGETIIGNTTSTVSTISAINNPDVEINSGEILYVQHFAPVERTTVSRETIKLILKV